MVSFCAGVARVPRSRADSSDSSSSFVADTAAAEGLKGAGAGAAAGGGEAVGAGAGAAATPLPLLGLMAVVSELLLEAAAVRVRRGWWGLGRLAAEQQALPDWGRASVRVDSSILWAEAAWGCGEEGG